MSSMAGITASTAYQQVATTSEAVAAPSAKNTSSASSPFLSLPLPEPIKTDLSDLSTALQKGNMDAAQTAFSNLIADMTGHYQGQTDESSTISLVG